MSRDTQSLVAVLLPIRAAQERVYNNRPACAISCREMIVAYPDKRYILVTINDAATIPTAMRCDLGAATGHCDLPLVCPRR